MADEPRIVLPGIEKDIGMISSSLAALRELASDEARSRDGDRVYDFSIRWGVLLSGRLMRLEYYYRRDELTAEQRSAYRRLRREMREAMPLVERLGLGRPRVPLED